MPLDKFARRFLDLVAAGARNGGGEPTVADMRRGIESLSAFADASRPFAGETRDAVLPGRAIAIRIYSPHHAGSAPLPGLIYFHGGGWLSGGLESHDAICRALAEGGRCRVLAVDYRLAPEHRFPAAIEDCRAAVAIIVARAAEYGLDPKRIGVAGDSAGGNLAVVVCQAARASGIPIALQVLLCPVMDALGRTNSRRTLGEGYFLEERTLERYWEHYRIDGVEASDPRVSPLRAGDFRNLPSAIIHTAEYDPLVDEGALYAAVLARAGVAVRHHRHPGMIHHFYGLGGVIPYAATALDEIGAQIRAAWS